MTNKQYTSLERTLTAIGQQEPDRVPLFLLLTMHGARELGMSIGEYFSNPMNVATGQLRMRTKYKNDCIYSLYYAPIEIEAWGGEVIFYDDGPPNSGEPFIKSVEQINRLEAPRVSDSPQLLKVLETIKMIYQQVGGEVPIIGVVMSPFSLPVMQMGFEKYLEVLYYHPELFNKLMLINESFCLDWANAQIEAGATAICYFDPLASPTIIERNTYLKTGFQVAKRVIPAIKGPTATHMASGIVIPVLDELVETGTLIAGVSANEHLSDIKTAANKRLTLLGNMNGLEMINWKPGDATKCIKDIIRNGARGGGLIISDNHGEIPWHVSEETLLEISAAVAEWGRYPLDWIG
ncbi:MAG TPA: uroporphyrinogen decarboxylase family protein [Clostridia bacterium]|nr:uroporphyrinogen decarboxylase family protein [Clostridia bacterium]HRX41865.1 uroporphyrinogen decarboxylase family protein [Clostridia bacterium]